MPRTRSRRSGGDEPALMNLLEMMRQLKASEVQGGTNPAAPLLLCLTGPETPSRRAAACPDTALLRRPAGGEYKVRGYDKKSRHLTEVRCHPGYHNEQAVLAIALSVRLASSDGERPRRFTGTSRLVGRTLLFDSYQLVPSALKLGPLDDPNGWSPRSFRPSDGDLHWYEPLKSRAVLGVCATHNTMLGCRLVVHNGGGSVDAASGESLRGNCAWVIDEPVHLPTTSHRPEELVALVKGMPVGRGKLLMQEALRLQVMKAENLSACVCLSELQVAKYLLTTEVGVEPVRRAMTRLWQLCGVGEQHVGDAFRLSVPLAHVLFHTYEVEADTLFFDQECVEPFGQSGWETTRTVTFLYDANGCSYQWVGKQPSYRLSGAVDLSVLRVLPLGELRVVSFVPEVDQVARKHFYSALGCAGIPFYNEWEHSPLFVAARKFMPSCYSGPGSAPPVDAASCAISVEHAPAGGAGMQLLLVTNGTKTVALWTNASSSLFPIKEYPAELLSERLWGRFMPPPGGTEAVTRYTAPGWANTCRPELRQENLFHFIYSRTHVAQHVRVIILALLDTGVPDSSIPCHFPRPPASVSLRDLFGVSYCSLHGNKGSCIVQGRSLVDALRLGSGWGGSLAAGRSFQRRDGHGGDPAWWGAIAYPRRSDMATGRGTSAATSPAPALHVRGSTSAIFSASREADRCVIETPASSGGVEPPVAAKSTDA